jgi:hypothetical protein
MKTIFISSPYINGGNALQQTMVIHTLIARGYATLTSSLSRYADLVDPCPYEEWLTSCLAWVARCDALVRLKPDVPSAGADSEVAEAERLGLPVFLGIDDVPHAVQMFTGTGGSHGRL